MKEFINPASVPQVTLYTGAKMPCIGMGTFGSDRYSHPEVAAAVLDGARIGYRLFDCASVYGNEDLIGESLQTAMSEGIKREQLFVMSKVWNDKHNEVAESCKQSLKDLRLDYLDAYFVHWPVPNYHPPHCTVDSRSPDAKPYSHEHFMYVWAQMESLVQAGLVRHIGVSNMTLSKLAPVLKEAKIKPALNEMELHPSFQQPELFQFCINNGIVPVGYCPVGSPNRPERDKTREDIADLELPVIVEIAKAHNVHPAVVCLKWAHQNGQVPIPFSTNPQNYTANLHAVMGDPLTPEEMAKIKALDANCRFIKGQVFLWEGAESWHDLWL